MSQELWTAVDEFLSGQLLAPDPVLDEVLRACSTAGLPEIQVSPVQAKLLYLFARMQRAQRILEVGTLGGYSAIWLARGLAPNGELLTLELDPAHVRVAAANVERAGLGDRIEILEGLALDSLPRLEQERRGPFDLVFIDADKESNPQYLDWAVRLGRPGTLIVVDNVVRDGRVLDADNSEPSIVGTRAVLAAMGAHPRLDSTAIQFVGVKGYDGFAVAIVKD